MIRHHNDFSSIILNEIALEGLDGITIEALCKRLSNNPNWSLKPVDDSVKKIVWSFVVFLKNVEFYRLENPRNPLIIYNRFEYVRNEFDSLYEPSITPEDIYPNHPINDGKVMGSCKEYFTRFNLGSFPRKISVEEAEKRWDRRLVIVANQEMRFKVLIPDDNQCTLRLSLRYYLLLERIGRSRYLGEASFGQHSLRTICSDPKTLSYIRNRLTDHGLIQNQSLPFSSGRTDSRAANRIVISSLTKFFVKREPALDRMVSNILDFLKSQPNFTASYAHIKTECNINTSRTFKLPLLKRYCDTNLMLNYRLLHPDASKTEYLRQKNETTKEKVIRCIRLKQSEVQNNEHKKTSIDGREFKLDSTFERQILRWIEEHGDLGVSQIEISNAFKFTTIGTLNRVLNKHVSLKHITKRYCDRGRSKVFRYASAYLNDEKMIKKNEVKNMPLIEQKKTTNNVEQKENDTLAPTVIKDKIKDEFSEECDIESLITRTMKHGYCEITYKNSKQSIHQTDRFYYREQIIFNMLASENIISLINIKKTIIEMEKENPKFIGTLDIKTLVKIVGYFEMKKRLKSVQYCVAYGGKAVNHSFVGTLSVDFTSQDSITYMNSFMNQFNNSLKTTKATKKWNFVVHNSPEPKINIANLKLPRFMKMRSLHEYLFYIVYDHPGESLTNTCKETETAVSSYRNDIVNGDKVELPKIYYPAIHWKMFVPPLQKYPNYPDGWFCVSDIIHHMPLHVMLKIVNFNKAKVNLEKLVTYATHPVFKYLPLMCLSSDVWSMLSQGLKKHVQNVLNTLRLLCMIGLIQFGQKNYRDTELIYAYLNKRAGLLNTVKSSPSYYRVVDMDYEKHTYDFTSAHELEAFWLDTWYFCTNTPLGFRMVESVKTQIPKRGEVYVKSKIVIDEACSARGALEAIFQDDYTIPGDNKGAAGFDSHLFSHLARNWSFPKKMSTSTVFPKKRFTIGHSLLRRLRKRVDSRKQCEKKKNERASHGLFKVRYRWQPEEDQVLLMWKLGTMLVKQVKSNAFISYGITDVFRSILGKFYRLKSVDNYLRRLRMLLRHSSIETRLNCLLEELQSDQEIKELFESDFKKQQALLKAKKFKAMRDLIISCIKQLIGLLRERGVTIDTKCTNYKKIKTSLKPLNQASNKELIADSNLDMQHDYPEVVNQQDSVDELEQIFTNQEIYTSIAFSLIHSSLSNQNVDPRVSLIYLEAFKQYPEEILKQAFNTLKNSNIIMCSLYHKESLQILLATPHIIQSKTYEYGPKFSALLVGSTYTGRYKDAFTAFSDIKEKFSKLETLLLYPSLGLCSVITSLSQMNIIDLSIEFDKKYLEYMADEKLSEGSKCLKNTIKRMRSRHFDLLVPCLSDSIEDVKIITSVTKQLKNYQVICKLKQSMLDFTEEINKISERIFSRSTFEPQLPFVSNMNHLCENILTFCKTKEHYGATQLDIKENFNNLSLDILGESLRYLKKRDLILEAGVKTRTYVHYKFAYLWLVKIPRMNLLSVETILENDKSITLPTNIVLDKSETTEPPIKKMRLESETENTDSENFDFLKVRPWTRIDSSVNKESLEKFLNSVMSKIIAKPGIYLKHLQNDYCPLLPPMQTRELVEILVDIKCVKMIHVEKPKLSFFTTPPQNYNLIFSDAKGLEDSSTVMLEPTLDCEIRFGYFTNITHA